MSTRQYDVLTRISVYEAGFIPRSRHLLHKVDADFRCIGQVIWRQRKVLNGILEKDRCSQLENIGRTPDGPAIISSVQTLIKECPAKLHAAQCIADKRMQASVKSLVIAEMLLENQILRGQHGFASHVVGIHALPSTRDGTTVKDNHQSMVIRITQYLFIETYCFLLVTPEKVHLDTFHAYLLQPTHLLLAPDDVIHTIDGTLFDIIPIAAGTIPQEYVHAFAVRILHQILHAFTSRHFVPPAVYQDVFIAHRLGQINILHLVSIVGAIVLPQNPTPCTATEFIFILSLIQWLHHIPCHRSFYDGLQRTAYSNCAPRGTSRQGKSRLYRSVSIILLRHGESNRIKSVVRVAQV